MASTNFIDYNPSTPIRAAWLNDVNTFVYNNGGGLGLPKSVVDFGAKADGTTNDTAAFQAAVNSVTSGTTTIRVPRTCKVSGTVTASTGTVVWEFDQGAGIVGGGTLPFWSSAPGFITTPQVGTRIQAWDGTTANFSTNGTTPTSYMQRVDKSVVGDDASHLIFLQYNSLRRLVGGTGWLTTNYNYLEDASNTGAAQSVAVSGSAHVTGNASVWALYGEAVSSNAAGTITACELDSQNFSGSNYPYNDTTPVALPFATANFLAAIGTGKSSFAQGIVTVGTAANNWHVGIYFGVASCDHIGIDMQCQPPTLIGFKYGASTDGTGITVGGVGLDVDPFGTAAYGTGSNQCAIHLRTQRLGFGSFGFIQFNTPFLEIFSAPGVRACHLNLTTGVWIAG